MSFFRYDFTVQNAVGEAIPGVQVYILTQPADTTDFPPSPLATIFSDSIGTALANPITTDGNGNGFFYAAQGTYTVFYFDPFGRIPNMIFPDQEVVSPGGGSVTSVAMTGDGVVFAASVTGSPIVDSGTLVPVLQTQNINLFLASPSSGSAGPWTARRIAASDLPAGIGTVSSVAMSLSLSALLSGSVTGTPITGSGTLAVTLGLAGQNPNTVLAGPTGGALGPVTARALVAADIFGVTAVPFSATPVFDASTFACPTFTMTLTGNVGSSTVSNPALGQEITFILTQDGTGGRAFTWPANFKGASAIAPDASSVSVQSFKWDGSAWRATDAGLVTAS
jgi:hypothetical protein